MKFRKECRSAMQKFIMKLMNRSLLSYPLTQAATCLDPQIIVSNVNLAKSRLTKLLSILTENDRINGSTGDVVLSEFKEIITLPEIIEAAKSYLRTETRIDHFWRENAGKNYKNFMLVVKIICCLSHGNANLDCGFSVNSECLFENMHEESVVARRQVYDPILNIGGVENFAISKSLIHSARNAHPRWIKANKQRRLREATTMQEKEGKKRKALEIKELEAKRRKILEQAQKEAIALEEKISEIKK